MFPLILAYCVCAGLFGSLSIFEVSGQSPDESAIYQNKSVTILKGNKLVIKNTMTLDKEHCYQHEVEVHVFKKLKITQLYGRLASCPQSKDWATDSTGVINYDTMQDFNLQNNSISLKCSVNRTSNSHHQFDLHTKLEIDETATCRQPFDHADFIVICTGNDSQKIRHDIAYSVVYDNGTKTISSIDDEQASLSTLSSPVNLTSSVTSTAKVENIPGKKKETDRLLAWYLVIPLAIIFGVLFWLVMITVSRLSKSRIRASEEV